MTASILRPAHRWTGILFTATVILNFAWMPFGQPPDAVVYLPLAPLAVMLLTGVCILFQHYVRGRA